MVLSFLAAGYSASAEAQEGGFFGPDQGFEIQPEVDAYYHVDETLRLLLQVQSTFIPSEDFSSVAVGGFADWFIVPLARTLLSPDIGKTRALNIRVGARYLQTIDPGTVGTSNVFALQLDLTPRYFLPWGILATNRNRFQARWTVSSNDAFSFRFRDRLELEREFEIGKVGLTPFANVEWFWQSPPAMWTQFRMEAGLQCSFGGLGRGQIIEVNYTTLTNLQPSRSWRPVLGVVWYVFF